MIALTLRRVNKLREADQTAFRSSKLRAMKLGR